MKELSLPKKIAHIADIHIHNDKRHEEHIHVINNLKRSLIEEKPDVIYIAGDVVDTKTKISPDQLDITNYFFYEMSNIAPVICIIGNHDTNLYTPEKKDALTPIIAELNPINPIFLLRDSGIYNLFDIDWIVWSRTDLINPIENYKFGGNYSIGCYHGPIQGAVTDTGWNRFSKAKTLNDFGNCDAIMLGDIHANQFFKGNKVKGKDYFNCAYPGSLSQVDVSEKEEKGYLMWEFESNLNTYLPTFKQVENDYSIRTIRVEDISKSKIKDNQTIRLIIPAETTGADMINLRNSLPNNIIFQKEKVEKTKIASTVSTLINDLPSDKEYFIKYFKELGLEDSKIKELEDLDSKYNNMINIVESIVSEYDIQELEIKNFLIFKGINIVNFEEKNGLVGLFGENGIGKSSLMIAIMFCLFNRTLKDSNKFIKLINDQLAEPEEVYVQLRIVINGAIWEIKRSLIANNKMTSASTKLEVYEYVNGVKEPRHKTERVDTDKNVLAPLIGNEDMFIITVLSSQNQSLEFTDKKNSDRLELTNDFLGLNSYLAKYEIANKELLREKTVNETLEKGIKVLEQPKEIELKIEESKNIIKNNNVFIKEIETNFKSEEKDLKELQEQLNSIPLISLRKTYEGLVDEQEALNQNIKITNDDIKNLNVDISDREKDIDNKRIIRKKLKEDYIKSVEEWDKFTPISYLEWEFKTTNYESTIDSLKEKIENVEEKIKKNKEDKKLINLSINNITDILSNLKIEKEDLLKEWDDKTSYKEWVYERKDFSDLISTYKQQIEEKGAILGKKICHTCGKEWSSKDESKTKEEIESIKEKITVKQKEQKEFNEKASRLKLLKDSLESLDKTIKINEEKKSENTDSLNKTIKECNKEKEHNLLIEKYNLEIEDFNKKAVKEKEKNDKARILKSNIEASDNKVKDIRKEIEDLKLINEKKEVKIESLKNTIIRLKTEIISIENEKKDYIENEKKIKERKVIQEKINEVSEKINNQKEEIKPFVATIEREKTKIETYNTQLEAYNQKLEELQKQTEKLNLYSYYVASMGKKGISLLILRDFIPYINEKLNETLTDLFNFNIEFEVTDSNTLEISFSYNNLPRKVKRDVNQACGEEATLINLVIRAALTKVSKLPKPSLLLLDEKFSMLDKSNLSKLPKLLEKLKEQYKVIIMITHDDDIKDWPDNYIILENKNGITTIN